MTRLMMVLVPVCALLISNSTADSQYSWIKSGANPVLPERSTFTDDPSYLKYAFEPTILYDTTVNAYRMWFTSLVQGFGARFALTSAISTDGEEWFVGMRNPVFSGVQFSFDNSVRCPRIIRDGKEFKMYYTGQVGDALAIGLAVSPDGKSWQRYSDSPLLRPDTVSRWDTLFQAFCDVYFDGSTYMMWFTGGDGLHGGIGVATSPDGIHWTEHPANPVFSRSVSGWDSGAVGGPAIARVRNEFYMFYGGTPVPGTLSTGIGLAISGDGIQWTRVGSSPVLATGTTWESAAMGNTAVLYRNGTFHLWYSALSGQTGHWQTGHATAPYLQAGIGKPRENTDSYALMQNYPNPFNPGTIIRYTIPRRSRVTITVYDELGQRVTELIRGDIEAGPHEVRFDGTGLATGVYYYRLLAGSFTESKKFLLLR